MTWVRLDDQWLTHPKFADVGDFGRLLWVSALTLSSYCLTDGRVSVRQVQGLLRSKRHLSRAIQELVNAGLWSPVDGGYQIHDYEHYQTLAAVVKANRAAARERMQRWRENRGNGVTNAVTNGVTNAVGSSTRVRARAWDVSDLSAGGVQGGAVEANAGPTESGYDLAWRVWSDLWRGKYRTTYQRGIDQGPKGDDRVLQRVGELASACAEPEATLRHKLARFFVDPNPWLTSNRHPLRAFEADWNKYGEPAPAPATPSPRVEDAPMTAEQCAAARKLLDEQNAQRAADREKRQKISADLETKLRGVK